MRGRGTAGTDAWSLVPPPCMPAGANEMTYSLQYLRQFMRGWQGEAAGGVRIFFPDAKVRRWMAPRGAAGCP